MGIQVAGEGARSTLVKQGRDDDPNGAKRSIALAGIVCVACPFRAMHDLRGGGDGGTSLAGTRAGAMAGGDGAR
jgi:hypothetical protein